MFNVCPCFCVHKSETCSERCRDMDTIQHTIDALVCMELLDDGIASLIVDGCASWPQEPRAMLLRCLAQAMSRCLSVPPNASNFPRTRVKMREQLITIIRDAFRTNVADESHQVFTALRTLHQGAKEDGETPDETVFHRSRTFLEVVCHMNPSMPVPMLNHLENTVSMEWPGAFVKLYAQGGLLWICDAESETWAYEAADVAMAERLGKALRAAQSK